MGKVNLTNAKQLVDSSNERKCKIIPTDATRLRKCQLDWETSYYYAC